jgi:hypothetical protein
MTEWTVEDLDKEIARLRNERSIAIRKQFVRKVREETAPMMIDALRAMEDDHAFYQRVVRLRELLAHLEYESRSVTGDLVGMYDSRMISGVQQAMQSPMNDLNSLRNIAPGNFR